MRGSLTTVCILELSSMISTQKYRSNRVPSPGVFLLMDDAKSRALAAGVAVVDLSIGASDLPPPPEALEALRVRPRKRLCAQVLDIHEKMWVATGDKTC